MTNSLSAHTIVPGLYRLKADVANPRADKRVRWRFWQLPAWKAGQVFVVESELVDVGVAITCIRAIGNYQALAITQRNDDVLALIVPHLEPVERTLAHILLEARESPERVRPEDVLEQLVLDGAISLETITVAIHAARARERSET
jgi:hypothetical protein